NCLYRKSLLKPSCHLGMVLPRYCTSCEIRAKPVFASYTTWPSGDLTYPLPYRSPMLPPTLATIWPPPIEPGPVLSTTELSASSTILLLLAENTMPVFQVKPFLV